MTYQFEGKLTEQGHELIQRVYYEDTDFSGAVYHARYLHFMERGRTEFIRCQGLMQSEALTKSDPDHAVAFVVSKLEVKYLKPARMDDILTITTEILVARGARMELYQRIFRGDELLIDAKVVVACVNGHGRARRLPESLK